MSGASEDASARHLERAVGSAIPGLVASLAPWGVTGAHWLPGPDGTPVLWLSATTDAQVRTLQSQQWLTAQVEILLVRYAVPHESLPAVRVMFDSEETIRRLVDGDA